MVVSGLKFNDNPTCVAFVFGLYRQGPACKLLFLLLCSQCHELNAGDAALLKKRQHCLYVIRWAIAQLDRAESLRMDL